MDPTAALYMLLDLISQGEVEEATYCARDLERWIVRGGGYPVGIESGAAKSLLLGIFNVLSMTRQQGCI